MTQEQTPPEGEAQDGKTPEQQEVQRTDLNTLPADVIQYIKELRGEAEKSRKEKKAAEIEAQKQERERLEKLQEWETLAKQYKSDLEALTPRAERTEVMEQLLKDMAQKRIDELPTQFQSLIDPNDPVKALAWLEANAGALKLPGVPNLNAGQQGDASKTTPQLTPEQEALIAKIPGMTREKYIAQIKRQQG